MNRGNKANLPTKLTDGHAYFCVDTGDFFIDYADSEGILYRKKINAKDAETLTGVSLGEIQNSIPTKVSQLDNDSNFISEEQVESYFKSLNSDRTLRFYCIEDVTVIVNGVSTVYPANSNVEVRLLETDIFEIVPTSNNSILALNGYPGALGTYYPWLEGVKQFSGILFDMNPEDMYTKWSQGN